MRLTDWEQRQLDAEFGEKMDREAEARERKRIHVSKVWKIDSHGMDGQDAVNIDDWRDSFPTKDEHKFVLLKDYQRMEDALREILDVPVGDSASDDADQMQKIASAALNIKSSMQI